PPPLGGSMWSFRVLLLLAQLLVCLCPPCPREPFDGLVTITEALGGGISGGSLPPLPLPQVCPAETLGCFGAELGVIGLEHREQAVELARLQRHLEILGFLLPPRPQEGCPPCEGHPEQPTPRFLAKLLELLQVLCAPAHWGP
uniref:Interleukin n=1 Tax=Ornithorhynchus anatinus TaxID=9258 RepID=A0A6I8P8J9_ORNAN